MTLHLTVHDYTIELFDDASYPENTSDSLSTYDLIVGESAGRPSSTHGISISRDGNPLKRILILASGGATSIHESCYQIVGDCLFVCAGDSIYKISLPELVVEWKTTIDVSTALQIFKLYDEFIVHGEVLISRMHPSGKIIWQHSGSDIFVTPSGKNEFEIKNNHIFARSWDGRTYCFNFDGKECGILNN